MSEGQPGSFALERPILNRPLNHTLQWKFVTFDYASPNDFLVINDAKTCLEAVAIVRPPHHFCPERPRLIVEDLGYFDWSKIR
jgi:hypothetical protein